MKRIIKFFDFRLTAFVLLILCLSASSCGSDGNDLSESATSVVGVWRLDFEDGYQLLTLGKDGNYSLVEFDFVSENWAETGKYYTKENIMTRIDSDYPDEPEVYTILTLTSQKMVLRYEGQYVGQHQNYYDKDYEDWTRVE